MNRNSSKFVQPKNFVRKNTKGMTKSQARKFNRKLAVMKKNSSV